MLSRYIYLLCLFVLTGCSREQSASPMTEGGQLKTAEDVAQKSTASDSKQTPLERASLARESLFNELSTRLLAAMSNGGPAKAIEVCSKLAPKLAKEVGEQHHVSIGRTAIRLRNENNRPPTWAEPLLKDLPTKPVVQNLENGRTGVLFPILLKVQCLTCHGPDDKIAAEIRTELARLYPNDKATGFQEGDLRGWFWVEVPADSEDLKNSGTELDAN
jgi:hypothetical protein